LKEFNNAVDDDLNFPKALQVLWKLVRDENAKGKLKIIKEMDKVLGLDLLKKDEIKIPKEILKLVEEREKARLEKNWKKSDELREKIKKIGYGLDDTSEGVKVRKL
jgi:cysteinyl-tRNA synthetase